MASNYYELLHVQENQISVQENQIPASESQASIQTPSIDSMMREVLHLLGKIDFEHDIQLEKLENSSADQAMKSHLGRKIRAAHRERREPYLELLTTLRQRQQRLSKKH